MLIDIYIRRLNAGHASSFQQFAEVERFGMLLLTIGPVLNIVSCFSFHLLTDPQWFFQSSWLSTEVTELLGIGILDISLIDMDEYYVLTAELIGFTVLCAASMVTYDYSDGSTAAQLFSAVHLKASEDVGARSLQTPSVGDLTAHSLQTPSPWSLQSWLPVHLPHMLCRLDTVHCSECCGLIMLMIVAVAQFQIKLHKHQQQQQQTGLASTHDMTHENEKGRRQSGTVAAITVV